LKLAAFRSLSSMPRTLAVSLTRPLLALPVNSAWAAPPVSALP
jgi:hypothetical protein